MKLLFADLADYCVGMKHVAHSLGPALLDLVVPAYAPCPHFAGACHGACVWDPPAGLVPCAFGGAIGALDEVQLVIVTAEPGDPPDGAGYRGGPAEMVRNSLRIFHEAMQRGGLERVGRPTPFHRNLRKVLNAFWPGNRLEAQLTRTWLTNAVLCPAEVTGGKHPLRVERACASTYLAPQLALFPDAFVLALGAKAARRMRQAGLRFDAEGPHPSARLSGSEKAAAWGRAAARFRGEPSDAIEPTTSPTRLTLGRTSGRTSPMDREAAATAAPDREFAEATASLPPEVADFLRRLAAHPEFACTPGRMQIMIHHQGAKVGGLNRRLSHWYVSKVFVKNRGAERIMGAYGFRHVIKNEGHQYWCAEGAGACTAFESALEEMTGTRLS